jgi:hypothetical protein
VDTKAAKQKRQKGFHAGICYRNYGSHARFIAAQKSLVGAMVRLHIGNVLLPVTARATSVFALIPVSFGFARCRRRATCSSSIHPTPSDRARISGGRRAGSDAAFAPVEFARRKRVHGHGKLWVKIWIGWEASDRRCCFRKL